MPFRSAAGALTPEELELLQKVFDQVVSKDTLPENRDALAARIMVIFRNGTTTEDELIRAVKAGKAR